MKNIRRLLCVVEYWDVALLLCGGIRSGVEDIVCGYAYDFCQQ